MIYTGKNLVEAFGNFVQVFEGKFTGIQLAVGKNFVNQVLNQSLDSGRSGVFKGSGRSLNCICKHDQSGLTGLGLGARVPEIINIDGILTFALFRFFIKEFDETGTVMLFDRVDDDMPQFIFPGNFNAVFDMRD